jgi:hypothetical protein
MWEGEEKEKVREKWKKIYHQESAIRTQRACCVACKKEGRRRCGQG